MKQFKNKNDALKWCFENLTPSRVGLKTYNRLRQNRKRFNEGEKIGENAISEIFQALQVKSECIYFVDIDLNE